jgi:Undecaprenyl-phosphate glucose phosphotransferase
MAERIILREPDLLDAGPLGTTDRNLGPISLEAFLLAVQASDWALVFACGALMSWPRMSRAGGVGDQGGALLALAIGSSMAVAALRQLRCYRRARFRVGPQATCIAAALLLGAASLEATLIAIGADPGSSLRWAAQWLAITGSLLALSRCATLYAQSGWRAAGRTRRRIMMVGAGQAAASFLTELERTCGSEVNVLGAYVDQPPQGVPFPARVPVRSEGVAVLVRDAARLRPDAIVLGLDRADNGHVGALLDQLSGIDADVFLVRSGCGGVRLLESGRLGGGSIDLVSRRPLDVWQAAQKRIFDTACSLLVLALCAPLLILVAALIKLDSPGPALFRQPRIGFRNAPFVCFKFRSMQHHMADRYADRQTEPHDPRVTRMGRILRATSLDELPQLLNVLRGEMSLVGPRPHAPNTKAAGRLFAEIVPNYASRHRMKPGITGWAQVNGFRGQTTTFRDIRERVRHDLYYIDNWSLWFDCRILLATVFRGFVSPKAF